MPIKTFRGLIADDTQDTIVLHTNNGSTGYRIVKLELISPAPGVSNGECVVKVFSTSQTTIDATIDFSVQTLLAAGYYQSEPSSYSDYLNIIFDNIIFNQDIYVTNKDAEGNSTAMNYYIELEQIKLDLNENTVATLKDIRNS